MDQPLLPSLANGGSSWDEAVYAFLVAKGNRAVRASNRGRRHPQVDLHCQSRPPRTTLMEVLGKPQHERRCQGDESFEHEGGRLGGFPRIRLREAGCQLPEFIQW